MVTRGQEYIDKGGGVWEQQRAVRTHSHLVRKARVRGYEPSTPVDDKIPSNAVTAT